MPFRDLMYLLANQPASQPAPLQFDTVTALAAVNAANAAVDAAIAATMPQCPHTVLWAHSQALPTILANIGSQVWRRVFPEQRQVLPWSTR